MTRRAGVARRPEAGRVRVLRRVKGRGRRVEKTYSTHNGTSWVEQSKRRFVYDGWNVVLVLDGSNDAVRKYTLDSPRFASRNRLPGNRRARLDAACQGWTWGLDLSGQAGRSTTAGVRGAGGTLDTEDLRCGEALDVRGPGQGAAVDSAGLCQGQVGGLLAWEDSGAAGQPTWWYFYEDNGNVGQLIDGEDYSTGGHYEYDPYGNTISATGNAAAANPFRFSTKWLDEELTATGQTGAVGSTGLYYYGYRYYSPGLGRWVNRDPMGEAGGLDLYSFVGCSPANRIDVLGKCFFCCPDDCKPRGKESVVNDKYVCLGLAIDANGADAAKSLTKAYGLVPPGSLEDCYAGPIVDVYISAVSQASGNSSGYQLWRHQVTYKCASASCWVFWTRNRWEEKSAEWIDTKSGPVYITGGYDTYDDCQQAAADMANDQEADGDG